MPANVLGEARAGASRGQRMPGHLHPDGGGPEYYLAPSRHSQRANRADGVRDSKQLSQARLEINRESVSITSSSASTPSAGTETATSDRCPPPCVSTSASFRFDLAQHGSVIISVPLPSDHNACIFIRAKIERANRGARLRTPTMQMTARSTSFGTRLREQGTAPK